MDSATSMHSYGFEIRFIEEFFSKLPTLTLLAFCVNLLVFSFHLGVMCSDLPIIINGWINVPGPFFCGVTVRYLCDAGYSLVGRSEISCLTNGQWDGPGPRCVFTGNSCIYISKSKLLDLFITIRISLFQQICQI